MEIYKLLPLAIWILWSGIWLISGINLFQGKGTHARKIKDMANGKREILVKVVTTPNKKGAN